MDGGGGVGSVYSADMTQRKHDSFTGSKREIGCCATCPCQSEVAGRCWCRQDSGCDIRDQRAGRRSAGGIAGHPNVPIKLVVWVSVKLPVSCCFCWMQAKVTHRGDNKQRIHVAEAPAATSTATPCHTESAAATRSHYCSRESRLK